jgi:L-alanine-DL-glutamate epimerase-like enolase superfamily enzyme
MSSILAKIERIEILMVCLEPHVIRTDAIQSFVIQETPIVRITDSDGAIGTGYSYTIGTGGHSVMALLERTLAPALLGRDADAVEQIWRDLVFLTHATTVGAITAISMAAIDTALWDLRSRKAGIPLHKLAGGAQSSIPLYSTEGGWLHLDAAALVDDAVAVKAKGFGGAKVKVGRPVHEDVARLRAVREAVGDDFEIFIDANQSLHIDQALIRSRRYEEFSLGWLEEPLPADDIDGHNRLAHATSLPIAVGESIYSIRHFREYLQRGACSIVQVDVGRIGGITPWLKVAHMAECFNVTVCPHFLMELHVALCAAVPNARWVEYIPQLDSITTEGMRIENGRAFPSEQPGLGIAWDWDAIRAHAILSKEIR